MDADGTTKKKAEKDKKSKKDSGRARWAVQVFCISVVLSGALSFASGEVLEGAGLALAFAVLAAFIVLGIVFVFELPEKWFHYTSFSLPFHRKG